MKKGIYIITNKVNGKVYIGQSKKLNQRYGGHLYRLKRKEHHNEILQRAFDKYGVDNFEYNILEEVLDDNILSEREKYWIDFYGGINNDQVYNLKDPLLNEHSNYIRNKMSKNNTGENNPNYGNKWTEEMKKKASNKKKGKSWEELYGEEKAKEMKKKAAKSQEGRVHSEATKNKIRQHNIGEKNPAYGKGDRQLGDKNPMFGKSSSNRKAILQFDKNGNFIKEYEFICQVKNDGFNIGNVGAAVKGKLKSAGGFIWKYKE